MARPITCPACAASFTPADVLRGKKAFCPTCGASLIVTSFGVAKKNETRRPVPARTPPARTFNPVWLLLPLVLFFVLLPGGLALYLLTRGQPEEPKQVAKYDDQPSPPAPNHQYLADDPSATRKKEPDPGKAPPPDKGLLKDQTILVPPIKSRPPEPPTFKVRETATLAVKDFTVYSLAFSPDGKTLAGGGQFHGGGTAAEQKSYIRLWDAANLKNTKKTMTGTDQWWVTSMSFSPDGKTLVSSRPPDGATEATLWNVATGEGINTHKSPTAISGVAFSRDGKTVAVASSPSVLWDVSTGKTTTLPAGRGPVAFSPDSKTVAAASLAPDGKTPELKLWSLAEGKNTATLTPAMPVVGLGYSADGKALFSAEQERTGADIKSIIEVWDVASGKKTRTVSVNEALVWSTWGNCPDVFTPDGKMLATLTGDSATVKLWDLASGKVVAELGHSDRLWTVAFSRDGTKVATATGSDGRTVHVHLWELTRGAAIASPPHQEATDNGASAQNTKPEPPGLPPLKVVGTHLTTPDGKVARLRGVNLPTLEWGQGENLFRSLDVLVDDWQVNFIRLTLSQDRWFGHTREMKDGGAHYRQTVREFVKRAAAKRCYVLLNLHFICPGVWLDEDAVQKGQYLVWTHKMPDDRSIDFWASAAKEFANHPAVLFDLYNEPGNVSWLVWRDGGDLVEMNNKAPGGKWEYHSPGMQKLLDTCRAQGAKNVVVAEGLQWGYDLSGIDKGFDLKDPVGNVAYSTHIYGKTRDGSNGLDVRVTPTVKKHAVLIGEFCAGKSNSVEPVVSYADQHQLPWLAWAFHSSIRPQLIKNWKYEPTPYGESVRTALWEAAKREHAENNGK